MQEVYDDGTLSEWSDLTGFDGEFTDSEYVMSVNINRMSSYSFRIRCMNKWGWGQWSDTLLVQPSTWPSSVDFDVYNYEVDGSVQVTWYEPDWHNS